MSCVVHIKTTMWQATGVLGFFLMALVSGHLQSQSAESSVLLWAGCIGFPCFLSLKSTFCRLSIVVGHKGCSQFSPSVSWMLTFCVLCELQSRRLKVKVQTYLIQFGLIGRSLKSESSVLCQSKCWVVRGSTWK